MERSFPARLASFLIFVLLTIVTIGLYPLYFAVTRLEEQNQLLQAFRSIPQCGQPATNALGFFVVPPPRVEPRGPL